MEKPADDTIAADAITKNKETKKPATEYSGVGTRCSMT
jgi:hypothetical protein